jgi:4-hydroxybenzoate polyprenyltransferase
MSSLCQIATRPKSGRVVPAGYVNIRLGKGALLGLFVVGFGIALFFSVYVWPRVGPVIGKVMDQLGDASKS